MRKSEDMARSSSRRSGSGGQQRSTEPVKDEDQSTEATSAPESDAQTDSGPDHPEGGEKASESAQKPSSGSRKKTSRSKGRKATTNHADAKFSGDSRGNADVQSVPKRPTVVVALHPFEYEQVQKGVIRASEPVYTVVSYLGSSRKGHSLAYPAGTLLDESVLEMVDSDD